MARNTINLDQINARLGDMSKPQSRNAYAYDDENVSDAQFREVDDQDEEQGGSSNATFFASILGIFLVFGGGSYFSSDILALFPKTFKQQAAPEYISNVDQVCSKGWRTNVPNVDQIHCAMTTNLGRLCNPQDKASLVTLLRHFDDDYNSWNTNMKLAVLGMAITKQPQSLQLGMEAAKADDPHTSDAERQKHMDNAQNFANNMMAGPNAILAQYQSKFELAQPNFDYVDLALGGYLSLDDFGGTIPEFLNAPSVNIHVKAASSHCSQTPKV